MQHLVRSMMHLNITLHSLKIQDFRSIYFVNPRPPRTQTHAPLLVIAYFDKTGVVIITCVSDNHYIVVSQPLLCLYFKFRTP